MKYTQPPQWKPNACYSAYLEEKLSMEEWPEYQKLRKLLVEKIPKLGEIGADELILKLSSHLNEVEHGN